MAQYRHRIFEIYEFQEEALSALNFDKDPTREPAVTERWSLKRLAVTHSANVTHVEFPSAEHDGAEAASELREDFLQLANLLERDSKVLISFAGVTSFGPAAIDELLVFRQQLRIKGSRLVLCCLDPPARDSFFQRVPVNPSR